MSDQGGTETPLDLSARLASYGNWLDRIRAYPTPYAAERLPVRTPRLLLAAGGVALAGGAVILASRLGDGDQGSSVEVVAPLEPAEEFTPSSEIRPDTSPITSVPVTQGSTPGHTDIEEPSVVIDPDTGHVVGMRARLLTGQAVTVVLDGVEADDVRVSLGSTAEVNLAESAAGSVRFDPTEFPRTNGRMLIARATATELFERLYCGGEDCAEAANSQTVEVLEGGESAYHWNTEIVASDGFSYPARVAIIEEDRWAVAVEVSGEAGPEPVTDADVSLAASALAVDPSGMLSIVAHQERFTAGQAAVVFELLREGSVVGTIELSGEDCGAEYLDEDWCVDGQMVSAWSSDGLALPVVSIAVD